MRTLWFALLVVAARAQTPSCNLTWIWEKHPQIPPHLWRKEQPEQCLISRFVRRDARVLELGGRIGRSTIVAAEVAADGRVWTSEASPTLMRRLATMVAPLGARVTLLPAISDVPVFERLGPRAGGEISAAPEVVATWRANRRVATVETAALDGLAFDTIVADCEGCFHALVRARADLLRRVHTVVLEEDAADDAEAAALQAALRSAGFHSAECVTATAHRRGPARPERLRPCAFQALTREMPDASPA